MSSALIHSHVAILAFHPGLSVIDHSSSRNLAQSIHHPFMNCSLSAYIYDGSKTANSYPCGKQFSCMVPFDFRLIHSTFPELLGQPLMPQYPLVGYFIYLKYIWILLSLSAFHLRSLQPCSWNFKISIHYVFVFGL